MKNGQKKTAALQVGDIAEGIVSGCSHEGLGVVRCAGGVVFVKNALPDERVRLLVESRRRGVFFGRTLDVLQTSPHRVQPKCDIFGECGGCALQHCSYEEQLRLKSEIVKNALTRIGGLGGVEEKIRPVVGMAKPYHYRNKGVFRVRRELESGKVRLGFLEENSRRVAAGRCSLLFPPALNQLLELLEDSLSLAEYAELAAAITKLTVRRSQSSGEMMLILLIRAQTFAKRGGRLRRITENLGQRLSAAEPLLKVFGYSIDRGEVNSICDNLTFCSEQRTVTERLGAVKYEISPASFFQVNSEQAAQMLAYLRRLIPVDTEQIIDAYSGIGTIGLALAGAVHRVECIESVPQAVADAENNCRLNGFANVGCHCGRAERLFNSVAENRGGKGRLVIVDPPRKGCHQELLTGILSFAPEHIIYVSCNPATLARDLSRLAPSYKVESVQPFDMFPQSYHVETVVLMSRVTD